MNREDIFGVAFEMSNTADELVDCLTRVRRYFPKNSLRGFFDVLGMTVSKVYSPGIQYRVSYHLEEFSWLALVDALRAQDSEGDDLGEYSVSVNVKLSGEYVHLSFDFEGHEFLCVVTMERAVSLGYVKSQDAIEKQEVQNNG